MMTMAAGSRRHGRSGEPRRWAALLPCCCLVCCLLGAGSAAAGQAPVRRLEAPPPLAPAVRIPVEPLGFRPPSRFYLTYRVPSATLDFVDDTHLLFTFHESLLMHREAHDPDDDEDQTIAAVLLELPSGKVVERTQWRLHDRGRYLWPMGHGRFLERERNTLYLLDKPPDAHFLTGRTPYFQSDGELVSVEVSPDLSRLLLEYREAAEAQQGSVETASSPAPTLGAPTLGDIPVRRPHKVRLLVIDAQAGDPDANKVVKTAILPQALTLPLLGPGYLEVEQAGGRRWKIRMTPFGGESRTMAEVTSLCQPLLTAISPNVFLAQLCIPNTDDHLMQAYDTDGHKLWEQQWQSRYVWGSFAFDENGSRFAYESIQLDHPIATLDPVDEESMTGQPVGVYDVADGKLRLVSGADPILSAGQNFALSSDGERFAVLRDGAIEVYKLPPAPVR
jgi:hypothetical protein